MTITNNRPIPTPYNGTITRLDLPVAEQRYLAASGHTRELERFATHAAATYWLKLIDDRVVMERKRREHHA